MRPSVATLALIALALAACTPSPSPSPAPQAEAATPAAPAPSPPAPVTTDAPAATPAPVGSDALARTDGYGALRLGMSADEARAAWTGGLKGDEVAIDNCAYLRPAGDTDFRVAFMFENGVLVRYDVAVDSEPAPGGGRIGQTRADIERLYPGRVEVQQHAYVPEGHYLRVTDPAIANGALLFETDEKGVVTRWRVGRAPQVDYVEGCA